MEKLGPVMTMMKMMKVRRRWKEGNMVIQRTRQRPTEPMVKERAKGRKRQYRSDND
jgi:hypothetical protein